MIEWMQKHKKWLVITIWISTISFIAAGMVGWGSYSFSLNNDLVARVGQVEISKKQFQNAFQRFYNQFNTDGKLDLNKAKELGLDQMALEELIQRALVENLALDLGLRVGTKEVEAEIAKLEAFWINGQFSFDQYKQILAQNGLRPSDFEEEVRLDLLVQKVQKILPFSNIKLTDLEQEAFDEPLYIQDRIKLKILDQKEVSVEVSSKQVREFWEQTKENYLYPQEYKIAYVLVKNQDQTPTQEELKELYEITKSRFQNAKGEIQPFEEVKTELNKQKQQELAEDKALREFVELKKSSQASQTLTLLEGDLRFGEAVLQAIENSEVGESVKPIELKEGFITFKILDKKPKTPKSFEDAKAEAKEALILATKEKKLDELAKLDLKNGFTGKDLGWLSPVDYQKLPFEAEEAKLVLGKIFTAKESKGMISLGKKIVLFEILGQELNQKDKLNPQLLQGNHRAFEMYKTQTISKGMFEALRKQYKVEKFAIQ